MRELRDIRLRRGLSQADLSAKTGVAEFTISQIEAGKRANPRPSTLRKLAQALDVEVADLYGSPEHPLAEAPPSPEQPPLNGFEEARRSEWDAAVRSARRLRMRSRSQMKNALASWHASKARGDASDARRAYLDEIGKLLQQAYQSETALAPALDAPLHLVNLDEFAELQAASRFYGELRGMVEGAGLIIHTGGAQEGEVAQAEQTAIHTVEEFDAA